jgi:hypothetical protein
MTKHRPKIERRLIVVSKRRTPTDAGLGRLVAAMVLHQLAESEPGGKPTTVGPVDDPEVGS